MALLEVKNLKTYFKTRDGDVKAVDDVSFTLNKGETLALVGESGCGKTTTALSIMKLLPKNGFIAGGEILVDGADITKFSDEQVRKFRWKKISIIFQGAMNALNPVLTIGEQIKECIMLHEDTSEAEAKQRVSSLLEMVEIDRKRVLQYPHEFSGGMRQRAMIAMALACNPDIIIGDEPTTALDVVVQAQIFDLIERLQKELNMAMILITHDLSVLGDTCDKACVMYAGQIVEYGAIEDIYFKARHPYTRKLIASYPNIYGEKAMPSSIPGAPPSLLTPPTGCRFHPRCDKKTDACTQSVPEMTAVSAGHGFACHLGGADHD